MANTSKTGITRYNALNDVWQFALDHGFSEEKEFEYNGANAYEATIGKMLDSFKPKARGERGESPVTKANRDFLVNHLDFIAEAGEDGVTAREFASIVPPTGGDGKLPTQKATRILVLGVNEGILAKVASEKKSDPWRYRVA